MLIDRCLVLKDHWASVHAVVYSPDGKILASGGNDCSIKLWDCVLEKEVTTLEPPEGRFVGYDNAKGTVYDPIEGKTPPFIRSFSFSADSKTLAVGCVDKSIRLWDMGKKQQRLKIELDYSDHRRVGNIVFGVAFAPDGKSLASASFDGIVRIWSSETGKLIRDLGSLSGIAYGVAFSPDGDALASCGENGVIKIWDMKKKELKYTLTRPGTDIHAIAVSPDGRYLVSAGGGLLDSDAVGELILWDFQTGKELAKLEGHKSQARCVAFSPDGTVLASGAGSHAAAYGDVILWDVAKREQLTSLNGHSDFVLSVAFSPDGKHLATGSEDKTVRICDVSSVTKH